MVVWVGVALLALIGIGFGPAPAPRQGLDWDAIGDEAVRLLQVYIRVDTTNPPGNEIEAAGFFASLFAAEGVPYEVFESEPGRGNIVARLRGDGSRGGAIVLLNHMDVVPAAASYWSVDPYAGEIVDGSLYGRGTTDMKSFGIVQFMAMAAAQRAQVPLRRDIVFLGTAGEETGGAEGAGYVVAQRPDILDGVEFVITEGGGSRSFGSRTVHLVETTQKTPLWLRLHAVGVAGHGSTAIRDSAANRLVRALDRIRTYRPEIRLVAPVAASIRAGARLVADPDRAAKLRQVERNIGDPDFLAALEPQYGNLLRNTIAITVMRGSSKTNVISPDAVAELDCRLLPGENPDLFLATLRDVIGDESIQIETLLRFEASESPRDTALWRAIEAAARRADPRAEVLPHVLAGFTDSHYFRERGIVSYGWSPIRMRPGDGPAHGVDEHVGVESIRRAPRILFDALMSLAASSD